MLRNRFFTKFAENRVLGPLLGPKFKDMTPRARFLGSRGGPLGVLCGSRGLLGRLCAVVWASGRARVGRQENPGNYGSQFGAILRYFLRWFVICWA